MHRIDHPTAKPNANGPGKNGFTNGDPGLEAGTIVDADILNALQENIAQAIEGAGIALVKGDHTQLLDAIDALDEEQAATAAAATAAVAANLAANQIRSAVFELDNAAGAIADTDNFEFKFPSAPTADTGYTIDSDIAAKVPTTGRYEVTLHGWFTLAPTANPTNAEFTLKLGATTIGVFNGTRYSGTNTHFVLVAGTHIADVTNIAAGFTLINDSGSSVDATPAAGKCFLTIKRLRGATIL